MTELNWNNFSAKFYGKESSAFENLAYQLFCYEHNLPFGIFRFKNQTGIETEPVEKNGKKAAFQAKFYNTKLSENKSDLIDSLDKAKRKNPDLDIIYLYLNKDFSESAKKQVKDPQYKTDIEAQASKLQLEIEWRTPGHFEIQLASPANTFLFEHFFSLGKYAVDFISAIQAHSANILYSIQNNIVYGHEEIQIDRSPILQTIQASDQSKIYIISGEGGCGKTGIIKSLFNLVAEKIPFYTFKATEFKLENINEFFKRYGNYNMQDFLEIHKDEIDKIIVIDSAENLSEIENQDPFREFVSALLKNSWKIIFTTRLNYLDDLKFQFIEIYRLPFQHLPVRRLSIEELTKLSLKYNFNLPSDESYLFLLTNLFYLDEYLQDLAGQNDAQDSMQFTNMLWKRKIQNSSYTTLNTHLQRESCFLEIAEIRSSSGNFFVDPGQGCSPQILSLLVKDEIIGNDITTGGYFITHDIYEEWALDILIERAFTKAADHGLFFSAIGTSLPMRRAFRKWFSKKLQNDLDSIKTLINYSFSLQNGRTFWNDEVIVSIMLSEYSSEFFSEFENAVLENDMLLLKKITFLLRIACKEVDDTMYNLIQDKDQLNLGIIFTRPKGAGWENSIDLMLRRIACFSHHDLTYVISVLEDWVVHNKYGVTTRNAALFALHFYKETQLNDDIKHTSNHEKSLSKIVLQGAKEISAELRDIFNEVIETKRVNNNDPYYDLCARILKAKPESMPAIIALPEQVMQIAGLYWHKEQTHLEHFDIGHGMERHYGLRSSANQNYFPASALQTPVYTLLQISFPKAVDFILDFTNKCIAHYAASDNDLDSVEQINLHITDQAIQKQYASHALYQMFRGTGSPVTPYLLQSIHMALEKRLLELADKASSEITESWLLYLLKRSESISITAVVVSVVLAHPQKLFKIAKILFRTIPLYHYDNVRLAGEHQSKALYSFGHGINYRTKSFEVERIQTCDEAHRQSSLETIVVKYQFFRDSLVTEEEAENRSNDIHQIIDDAYSELDGTADADEYSAAKLLLTRIDRRNMNPTVTAQDDKVLIHLNPKIDPELEAYRQEGIKANFNMMRFSEIKLWAEHKFNPERKYGDYPQYDSNPQLVYEETRQIIEMLNNPDENSFPSFNNAIPAYTCSALVRFYFAELNEEQRNFCKEVIIAYAALPLRDHYGYQIADGVEAAVNALPYLTRHFQDDIPEIKLIMLFILFDDYPLGEYKRICDYAIEAMHTRLWYTDDILCDDILANYLKFAPLYEQVERDFRKKSFRFHHDDSASQIRAKFQKKYKKELEAYASGSSAFNPPSVSGISVSVLETAFKVIPVDTQKPQHLSFIRAILPVLFPYFLPDHRNSDTDYRQSRRFFKRFSYFILHRQVLQIDEFLVSLLHNFNHSRELDSLLVELVSAQDAINKYEVFWSVWNKLYPAFSALLHVDRKYHYEKEIIHTYMLAWPYWSSAAKHWHSLKSREKQFYKKIVAENGDHPAILYSVVKVLNEAGSEFLSDGITWISDLLTVRTYSGLETNTIYYLEIIIRKYIYLNRSKIKKDIKIKNQVLQILNFLIDQSSVSGYLLREDIL